MASEWNEELYIPVELLNQVALWVANQQHPQGYFVETADVIYDRAMQVGLRGEAVSEEASLCPTVSVSETVHRIFGFTLPC